MSHVEIKIKIMLFLDKLSENCILNLYDQFIYFIYNIMISLRLSPNLKIQQRDISRILYTFGHMHF